MNFFETAMAVNLGISLSKINDRKPMRKTDLSQIPPYLDLKDRAEDFDTYMQQEILLIQGKYDEALALKHKK